MRHVPGDVEPENNGDDRDIKRTRRTYPDGRTENAIEWTERKRVTPPSGRFRVVDTAGQHRGHVTIPGRLAAVERFPILRDGAWLYAYRESAEKLIVLATDFFGDHIAEHACLMTTDEFSRWSGLATADIAKVPDGCRHLVKGVDLDDPEQPIGPTTATKNQKEPLSRQSELEKTERTTEYPEELTQLITRLKGDQQKLLSLIVRQGCKASFTDMRHAIDKDKESFVNSWKTFKRELTSKLKRVGWAIRRDNNEAILERLPTIS